ncbi:MAG: TonB-dependent receptor [Acidobacteriota bacterium]
MRSRALNSFRVTTCILACLSTPALRAETTAAGVPPETATIEVTATRVPEAVDSVPASITIVTGEELRARSVHDLAGALALVGGVFVAPGGDNGPAASTPEIWGLKEFDAFLLVVDGVPWGGAFNPALASVDLTNVERIEVLRGAAPVMYGATSFVGVIQIIHRAAGAPGGEASLWGGNYSSGGAAVSLALPQAGAWRQSLNVNLDQQGYRDDRTQWKRGHVLYRGAGDILGGNLHFDFDMSLLDQKPGSPAPREGAALSDRVPLDANHQPSDAKFDQDRFHLVGGYDRQLGNADWSTTLAISRTNASIVRGFLADLDGTDVNTAGFRQELHITDVYFDTHWALHPATELQVVTGADYLFGDGDVSGENFDYFVNLDGSDAPKSTSVPVQEFPSTKDRRNFAGVYGQAEWKPAPRWAISAGARINSTRETLAGKVIPGESGDEPFSGHDSRNVTRGSGVIGASYLAWDQRGDALWIYADARNTFKPAAIDFGPEGEGDILKPENATSYEAGLKGHNAGGRLNWDVSVFSMDFTNVVTSNLVDGLPTLVNTGKQRFQGIELEANYRLPEDLFLQAAYSHHRSEFRDFVAVFDDVETQLRGKRLETVPEDMGALGLLYAPARGVTANVTWNYIGDRFLNKRNTALAKAFDTWAAGVGYRFSKYEVRLDGTNLSDARDPISESELGDAQYYRVPARTVRFTVRATF